MKKIVLLLPLLFSISLVAQQHNSAWLENFAITKSEEYKQKKKEADDYAGQNNLVIRKTFPDGTEMELQEIVNGVPQYYITNNAGAAQTTRATSLYSGGGLGLNVSGNGYDKVAVWDGGKVLNTHQEFDTRITLGDSWSTTSDHATHVAGTIIASGVDTDAKGMAYEADLTTYYWDNDETEMALAAANGLEISNHSYGFSRGWRWNGSSYDWYGDTDISDLEDYRFGFYDSNSQEWDGIAYNAPYYLICKSAGNDRGDGPGTTPPNAEIDGGVDGFDCIGTKGVAKNILTVGAVNEVSNYTGPGDVVMSSFSSWGPADDGRIKPDIVAKGVGLYSSSSSADDAYVEKSGTSMSTPNTTGTLALLQQHFQNTHGGTRLKAATLKALIINTADEAGPYIGPDYMFGWGLLNAERAAILIGDDVSGMNVIDEQSLNNGETYTRDITVGSSPVKVTIVWTDPVGTPVAAQLNPSDPMLVNDLDLRLTAGSETHYAWKLDRNNPASAATNTAENNVDNVETVYIANPVPGTYTITVDHDGTLASSQDFSIVIQGLDEYIGIPTTCATLESPGDGASDVSITSLIQWTEVSDASSYDVYFGTNPSATNIIDGVNQGSTILSECLSQNTTYYLKIYPRNNQGARTTCSTWSFTTASFTPVSLPFTEDFNATSGTAIPPNWEHDSGNDFNWISNTGDTPSGDTGPDFDVSGGGRYLYTEASTPNYPAKKAIVYTPYFDLNTLSDPQLTFSYHMCGADMGTLTIDIFYEGGWQNLFSKTGQQQTTESEAWRSETIDLTPYKGCPYQRIRFFGTTIGWSSDMAIDEVSITNSIVLPMTLSSITTFQGPTTAVNPNTVNKEVVGVQIVTTGSGSPFSATSFTFNTRGTIDPHDISNAKLYYTGTSSTFATNQAVGAVVAAPNGTFSIIPSIAESELSDGTNYFWLTYDIESDATACYYIDAECNAVIVNSTAYLPTVESPAGKRQIVDIGSTIFFENFETEDNDWTLIGEFQRATPQGLGGEHGNADPSSAFSGNYVLGSDLSGLGANSGDYEGSLADRAYTATSPDINCSAKTNVHLTFHQWLNVEDPAYDHVFIDVWDGSSWIQKFTNTSEVTDNSWTLIDIDVSAEADGNANFRVRFSVGPTDADWFYSGWNIDDLTIESQGSLCDGTAGLWIGGAGNDDWNNPANWDDGNLPTATDNVVVSNLSNLPIIDEAVSCNNLNIKDGGTLNCTTGGTVTVNGNLQVGQGVSGIFNMSAGSCSISGNFYSEVGSQVSISDGSLSFVNWSKNDSEQWAKGNIHLSGGALNASGTVYFSGSDLTGIMDGPFNFNVAEDFYVNDNNWTIVTGGTITMTGTGSHYFLPSNDDYNSTAFNLVLSGGGVYYFSRTDGGHGCDIMNDLNLSNGTLHTTRSAGMNSYFNIQGHLNIGNTGAFYHGAFNSAIGGSLIIGSGSGGAFTIDVAGNCEVGQVPPIIQSKTRQEMDKNKLLIDSTD